MSRPAVVLGSCLGVLALFGPIGRSAAQDSVRVAPHDSVLLRADLTPDRLAQGRALFHGVGGCAECHGVDGVGAVDGPSLTTGPWSLGDGTPTWLVHMTRHGGWGATSPGGDPQRMRGPTVLDSAQVHLVADYVFSISRAKTPKP
jgi:mono/diheme cytochrome c family protein